MPALPDPLHPAVVHFPLALAALTPAFALLAWIAIARLGQPRSVWAGVVLLAALLAGSAWLAVETGEDEEERVEEVVAERYVEAHHESADRVPWLGAATAVVALLGLVRGRWGAIGRGATLVVSLVTLVAAVDAGRLGGELVYEHGAASAYTGAAGGDPHLDDRD